MKQFALALALTAAAVGCSKEKPTENTAQEGHISEAQGALNYDRYNEQISCLRTAFADSAERTTTTLPEECSKIKDRIEKALASKHPQATIVKMRNELAVKAKVICKGETYPVSWTKESNYAGSWMKETAKPSDSRVAEHRYGTKTDKPPKLIVQDDGQEYWLHGKSPFTETKLIITAADSCGKNNDKLLATQ